MSEQKSPFGFWAVVAVGGILATPLLYLALLGPLLYLCCMSGTLGEGTAWDIATRPLHLWTDRFGRLPEFYRDYLAQWARFAVMPV